MTDNDRDVRGFRAARKLESAARRRADMWSTAIGSVVAGVLGYWAFQQVAHALLFAFVVFSVSAVGNRVTWEMRDQQSAEDERRLDAAPRSDQSDHED